MKRDLIISIFFLNAGQTFTAGTSADQQTKNVEQQKTSGSGLAQGKLSALTGAGSKKGSGTMTCEVRNQLEAEGLKKAHAHERSKTLPVFKLDLPQAITYIEEPILNEYDFVLFNHLVDGCVALNKQFSLDLAENIQCQFQQKTKIKPSLASIYKKASEIAQIRANIAKKSGTKQFERAFVQRAAECDIRAKEFALIKDFEARDI